mgnify:CR=1 FL=1
MSVVKDRIYEIINSQPEDSSYEEIVRELAFDLMIERGYKDSKSNNVISNEEMKNRIKTWQK